MERTDRIAEEIKKEVSRLIRESIKDPRLPEFVSVTAVKVTRDLRYARVYVSIYGDEEKKKAAIAALTSASGFIRREIGQRISLRYTPEIQFRLDESIEYGMHITKLIEETMGGTGKSNDEESSED